MAKTFIWTPEKERAIELIHQGAITQARIAEPLGTTRRTVEEWARRPAFRARLDALKVARAWKRRLARARGQDQGS
jgi:predicted XRE-type DNA-binding protein